MKQWPDSEYSVVIVSNTEKTHTILKNCCLEAFGIASARYKLYHHPTKSTPSYAIDVRGIFRAGLAMTRTLHVPEVYTVCAY